MPPRAVSDHRRLERPILDVIRDCLRSQVPKRSHSVDLTRTDLALPSKQREGPTLLEVSLLGEKYVAGSTATNLARLSRSIALLSFLAVPADAPQPRQRLAAIFWPDSTLTFPEVEHGRCNRGPKTDHEPDQIHRLSDTPGLSQ